MRAADRDDGDGRTRGREGGRETLTRSLTHSLNLPDVVVWNPDVDKARAMKDLEENGYTRFCCVEPGRIAEPCILKGGEKWTGSQTIRVSAASS